MVPRFHSIVMAHSLVALDLLQFGSRILRATSLTSTSSGCAEFEALDQPERIKCCEELQRLHEDFECVRSSAFALRRACVSSTPLQFPDLDGHHRSLPCGFSLHAL